MRSALLLIPVVCLSVACDRDPGRDVKPMADPLREDAATASSSTDISPLEEVRKSQALRSRETRLEVTDTPGRRCARRDHDPAARVQAAAVSQRVANTEITVT